MAHQLNQLYLPVLDAAGSRSRSRNGSVTRSARIELARIFVSVQKEMNREKRGMLLTMELDMRLPPSLMLKLLLLVVVLVDMLLVRVLLGKLLAVMLDNNQPRNRLHHQRLL